MKTAAQAAAAFGALLLLTSTTTALADRSDQRMWKQVHSALESQFVEPVIGEPEPSAVEPVPAWLTADAVIRQLETAGRRDDADSDAERAKRKGSNPAGGLRFPSRGLRHPVDVEDTDDEELVLTTVGGSAPLPVPVERPAVPGQSRLDQRILPLRGLDVNMQEYINI